MLTLRVCLLNEAFGSSFFKGQHILIPADEQGNPEVTAVVDGVNLRSSTMIVTLDRQFRHLAPGRGGIVEIPIDLAIPLEDESGNAPSKN